MSSHQNKIDLDFPDDTPCILQLTCRETVSHWNDDYHDSAYDRSGIFDKLASIVASLYFAENDLITTLDRGFHLEDYDDNENPEGWEKFVAQKLRELNPDNDFVISSLDMWDRKRGSLKMTSQVKTTVGNLRNSLNDETVASNILENWNVYVSTEDDPMKEVHSIKLDED